jgi:hypothetical protein
MHVQEYNRGRSVTVWHLPDRNADATTMLCATFRKVQMFARQRPEREQAHTKFHA